jgi:hypothetical protein
LPQNSYFWRDDIFYIQITDDINDVVNNYEEFNTKREEIKNIIGLNLFRVRLPTDIVLVGSNS